MKIKDNGDYWIVFGKGCNENHFIAKNRNWKLVSSLENPTITPSMKITYGDNPPPELAKYCCHFNITNGQIIFHSDCSHELKGQTLDLVDIPDRTIS